MRTTTVHLIAAISAENGLEGYFLSSCPVNSQTFCIAIENAMKFGPDAIVFADNASYHRSKYTNKKLRSLQVELLLNVPYCPELNAIEMYFALLKNNFRRLKLEKQVKREEILMRQLVKEAMTKVSELSIRKICSSTLKKLRTESLKEALE